MQELALILGGARSGKSARAIAQAEALRKLCVMIATAEASDDEMADRIKRHRADRGPGWQTREEPLDLPRAIKEECAGDRVCVVDCLTLWLSNLMHYDRDVDSSAEELANVLSQRPGTVILVSNEVGLGLVPETPLGRAFRDAQGRLNQQVARLCDRVEFVAAGLPLLLKGAAAS